MQTIKHRIIIPLLKRFFKCTSFLRSRKHVLLACNGPLMADYLSEILQIFHADSRLIFKVVMPDTEERSEVVEYIRKMLPLPIVERRWAELMPWDLIIACDHCWPDLFDCKLNPTIFFGHGIDSCKLVEGAPYQYGKRALSPDGSRPLYSRYFAVSETEKEVAKTQNPLLGERIVVTGSLKADKMRAIVNQRTEIRQRRGFRDSDTVVLVLSTWGPNCLYHRMGDAIVEQALKLKHKMSFIFTMHPNEHRSIASSGRNWGEFMKTFRKDGFVVLEPYEEFETSVVACDVIITDHTSAAFYGLTLGTPLVYAPCFKGCVDEGSLVYRLASISPVLRDDAADLHERIMEARDYYPLDKLAEIANECVSFPGEAVARTQAQVYGLLNLPN